MLKNLKAQQRKKEKAEALKRANQALFEEADDDSSDQQSGDDRKSSSKKKKHQKHEKKKSVRIGDDAEVQEYDPADADEIDSEDEQIASQVASNTAKYSGVLGRLEEGPPQSTHAQEFITLGMLGQPNAGKSS